MSDFKSNDFINQLSGPKKLEKNTSLDCKLTEYVMLKPVFKKQQREPKMSNWLQLPICLYNDGKIK